MTKKLIETALPLEAINAAAKREKSIHHGHPSTLHLWWARRPLAAARAVIWSSLVDDPSAHPDRFPTEDDQKRERCRLHGILTDLVKWENSGDEKVLKQARDEIRKSVGGDLPEFLDPFAGGGALPLEAQRLGLKVHAHDLNPVAVMINKAMIEIPPQFADRPPVNPKSRAEIQSMQWKGCAGLAADVEYYGRWMKDEAFKRIGHLYPTVQCEDGTEAAVIAWIWARTVQCPNPACGCQMPLVKSWVLSTKKGKEACIIPIVDRENKTISYKIRNGSGEIPESPKINAKGAKFKCLICGETTTDEYIKSQGEKHKIQQELIAVVTEGKSGRLYLSPNRLHIESASNIGECYSIDAVMPQNPRWFSPPGFGFKRYQDIFTNRQLTTLTTFSDLVGEVYEKVIGDIKDINFEDKEKYAKAIAVYLTFVVDKFANSNSTICTWNTSADGLRYTFSRQAIPMTWDFAESNPFCHSSGCYDQVIEWVVKCIRQFPANETGTACRQDAQSGCGLRGLMISTDPPYYDNIGYADLSDYFYVWMRRSLKPLYPELFGTMLVPKAEELVATPYRFDGDKTKANIFFENGMYEACRQMYQCARDDIPVTIYYAYKQSETTAKKGEKRTASTGWETMLNAIIRAGFAITGTWPMNTEREGRSISNGTNALGSSIVLVCRKRGSGAPTASLREFQKTLSRELPEALGNMLGSNIAPVDLAQSAIGPGMAVYSRYESVERADGTPVGVREALEIINKEIDGVFNDQDSNLDEISRVCVSIFTQYRFDGMKFGDADVLARAKNTSVGELAGCGAVEAEHGIVRLNDPEQMPQYDDPVQHNVVWMLTHQLVRAMKEKGIKGAADMLRSFSSDHNTKIKELAYRLYTICDAAKQAQLAVDYNALVVNWADIERKAGEKVYENGTLFG